MQEVIDEIRKFRDARGWLKYHDPKSLAGSVCIEAAELLELFQWKDEKESRAYAAANKERVSEEIADVAIYLIELADVAGIDLTEAIRAKLVKNGVKYPVGK